MIDTKFFELRDRKTFIPVFAVLMRAEIADNSTADLERYLLRRAGYSETAKPLVMFGRLDGGESHYDAHDWHGRTYPVAHLYITAHWAELVSGQVIDVRYILGETDEPCSSEMMLEIGEEST